MQLIGISIRLVFICIYIATQVWCSRVSLHIEVSWYSKHNFNIYIYIFTFITKLLVVHIYSIITLAFRNISISMSNQITLANDWLIFDLSKYKTFVLWTCFSLLVAQWYCRLWGLWRLCKKNSFFFFHWIKYQFVFHLRISACHV